MDHPGVRSYIDGEEAVDDEVDGELLKDTGLNLTARTPAPDVEGPPPPPSRTQLLTVVAALQQNPQGKVAEREEQELKAMADDGELEASVPALDPGRAAQGIDLTKLPPIDRGYAWIIALGKCLVFQCWTLSKTYKVIIYIYTCIYNVYTVYTRPIRKIMRLIL